MQQAAPPTATKGADDIAAANKAMEQAPPNAINPSIRLTGRWDRHIVPLPFCRIRVMQAEPIQVATREPLRPLLARLQSALDEVAAAADAA